MPDLKQIPLIILVSSMPLPNEEYPSILFCGVVNGLYLTLNVLLAFVPLVSKTSIST
jgi:hypothetical protein